MSCFCRCLCCGYVTSTLRKNSHASNAHTQQVRHASRNRFCFATTTIHREERNPDIPVQHQHRFGPVFEPRLLLLDIFQSTNFVTRFFRTVRSVQTILVVLPCMRQDVCFPIATSTASSRSGRENSSRIWNPCRNLNPLSDS